MNLLLKSKSIKVIFKITKISQELLSSHPKITEKHHKMKKHPRFSFKDQSRTKF